MKTSTPTPTASVPLQDPENLGCTMDPGREKTNTRRYSTISWTLWGLGPRQEGRTNIFKVKSRKGVKGNDLAGEGAKAAAHPPGPPGPHMPCIGVSNCGSNDYRGSGGKEDSEMGRRLLHQVTTGLLAHITQRTHYSSNKWNN